MTLRQAIKAKGYTVPELAKETGISVRTLECYVDGSRKLRKAAYDTVVKITGALDINIDDIEEV